MPTNTPRCQRFAATTGTNGTAQRRLAKPRKNPEHHAKRGGNAKAVEQRVVRRRAGHGHKSATGNRRIFPAYETSAMRPARARTDDEPQCRAAEQREQRHAARGVNFLRRRIFWNCFVHVHSKALGFGRGLRRGRGGFFGTRIQVGAGGGGIFRRRSRPVASRFQSAGARCRGLVNPVGGCSAICLRWRAFRRAPWDKSAPRSASIAGTLTENFTPTASATNNRHATTKSTPKPAQTIIVVGFRIHAVPPG